MVTISPTLEMLARSEGTPTYHFVKLVQREMQKASIQAITLCYIQIFAIDGMDLELDGSLRSQIFDYWPVFEVLGHSMRHQMKSEMPSLEFNYYDYNDSSRVKWGLLHARYPRVFERLQQGARISVFDMQKAEVLFNALETCRGLLNIIGANPQLAVDMFIDYYSEADKINPVHRAVVILEGASPETGGQLHPQTGLRNPFWWKMVVTPIPEGFLNLIPTKLLEFPIVCQDTSLRSSWSDSVSDFSFEQSQDIRHGPIGSIDNEREDIEETTPKKVFSETLEVSLGPPSQCFKEDMAQYRLTPSVHPLVIGRPLRIPGTPAPTIGSPLDAPKNPATLAFSGSPKTKEKRTPRKATNKFGEMASEPTDSPGRKDSIQALIEQLIEEEDEKRVTESADSFRALAKHANKPMEELHLIDDKPGFVRVTADRPTLIRVFRPCTYKTDSDIPPKPMGSRTVSEPHVSTRSNSGAAITRGDSLQLIQGLGFDWNSHPDPTKHSVIPTNHAKTQSIRVENTLVYNTHSYLSIRQQDARPRSIKTVAPAGHHWQPSIEFKLKKPGFLRRLDPMKYLTRRRRKD